MNYFLKRQDSGYSPCDGILHEIKNNDTLYKISRLYQIPLNDLIDKNPMIDVYNLKIGDTLCIPVKHRNYLVKKGDTLDWILDKFDLDYESFRNANPQLSPIFLKENEMIFVPHTSDEGKRLN